MALCPVGGKYEERGSLGQAFPRHPSCQPDEKGAEGTEHKSVPLGLMQEPGTAQADGRRLPGEHRWLKATTRKGAACSSAIGLG